MSSTLSSEVIAIVIPCFNSEATLAATIESALAQSEAAQVVIVDDGSTDGSLEIARSFEPRVRVLSGPNQGVSAARNRGIAETTGDWIVFLDSDDLLTPETLTQRLDCARATGADVVICDWEEWCAGSNPTCSDRRIFPWVEFRKNPEIATATVAWAPPGAILYRRAIVEKIGGFPVDFPLIEDSRFLFDVTRLGARFAPVSQVGLMYRVHPASLSRKSPLEFYHHVLRNGEQIEALWRARAELTDAQRVALTQIYDVAARALFWDRGARFRDAVAGIARVGGKPSRLTVASTKLSSVLGIALARRVLALVLRLMQAPAVERLRA
jgi:glycosyltransferase involved in cell wall biosynthesis